MYCSLHIALAALLVWHTHSSMNRYTRNGMYDIIILVCRVNFLTGICHAYNCSSSYAYQNDYALSVCYTYHCQCSFAYQNWYAIQTIASAALNTKIGMPYAFAIHTIASAAMLAKMGMPYIPLPVQLCLPEWVCHLYHWQCSSLYQNWYTICVCYT